MTRNAEGGLVVPLPGGYEKDNWATVGAGTDFLARYGVYRCSCCREEFDTFRQSSYRSRRCSPCRIECPGGGHLGPCRQKAEL